MNVKRACILAAGIGNRLGEMDDKPPKSLLSFGGRTLLERHLDILAEIGVGEVAIGTGYRAEDVSQVADAAGFPGAIDYVFNPDYRAGSVVTLAALGDALSGAGGPVLLMDADVLYPAAMLARLAGSQVANCLLIDRDFEDGDEPVKVCVRGEREIVDFRKIVTTPFDWCGESVGFFKLAADTAADLADRARAYRDSGRGDHPYEEAIRDAILAAPAAFSFEDVTGLPWIEIDFPEDLLRAEREILPLVDA